MTDSTPAQECERCAQLGLQSPAVHTVNGLKLCETCAAAGVLNVIEAIDEAIEPVREADDPSARAEACAALARTCQKVADGLERSIANAAQGKVSAPVLPEPLERLANRVDTGLDLAHVAVKNLRDAAIAGSLTLKDSRDEVLGEYDAWVGAANDLAAWHVRLREEAQRDGSRQRSAGE